MRLGRWAAALTLLAFGCEPAVLAVPFTAGHSDAAGSGEDAAGATDGQDGGGTSNCEQPQQTLDTGHHNPGMDCLVCHNGQAVGAPLFKLAGTLYTSAAGTTPVVGGTIRVHTADGQTLKLITAQNGNFYTDMAIQFPIELDATACPDTAAMVAQLPGPVASCNNCHVAGGGAGSRIHLP